MQIFDKLTVFIVEHTDYGILRPLHFLAILKPGGSLVILDIPLRIIISNSHHCRGYTVNRCRKALVFNSAVHLTHKVSISGDLSRQLKLFAGRHYLPRLCLTVFLGIFFVCPDIIYRQPDLSRIVKPCLRRQNAGHASREAVLSALVNNECSPPVIRSPYPVSAFRNNFLALYLQRCSKTERAQSQFISVSKLSGKTQDHLHTVEIHAVQLYSEIVI